MPVNFLLLSDPVPASRETTFLRRPCSLGERRRGDKAGVPPSRCLRRCGGMKGVYPNPPSTDPGASQQPLPAGLVDSSPSPHPRPSGLR